MLNRFQDVFKSLRSHDVRYVVIGGIAAILHGVPRATLDLDILIEASNQNAEALLKALEEAGMGTALMISPEQLLKNEVTIFNDCVRLDVQTATPGIDFDEVWANRETMHYKGTEFPVLSVSDLLKSKLAAGRPVDLQDVRMLQSGEREGNSGSE